MITEDERVSIYRLYDKRDDSTHYIGLTHNALSIRLGQHLACDGSNPDRDAWIQETGAVYVGIEEIDNAQGMEDARKQEAFWIHHYLDELEPLTNIIIPGLDGRGYTKVKSLRAAIVPVKSRRNTEKYAFWSVGIPRNSLTYRQLVQDAEEKGIAVSKLIAMRIDDIYKALDAWG